MSSQEQQDMQNPHDPQAPQETYSPMQIRLYLASLVIFIVGLVSGIVIYVMAPGKNSAEQIYAVGNDPRYVAELQRMGGNAEVALAGFHQWFDGLWHGKPLGVTVLVLSAAVSAACFWLGHIGIFEPLPDEDEDEGEGGESGEGDR